MNSKREKRTRAYLHTRRTVAVNYRQIWLLKVFYMTFIQMASGGSERLAKFRNFVLKGPRRLSTVPFRSRFSPSGTVDSGQTQQRF